MEKASQNSILHRGYDYCQVHELVAVWGYVVHIWTRSEEAEAKEVLLAIQRIVGLWNGCTPS